MTQLHHISILAYEGVMNNKIVFTQDELPSILPKSSLDTILGFFSSYLPIVAAPAQQDLPAMGVLQRVQWVRNNSESMSYNFIHLSIQEMLAAYRISQMGNDEQVKVFQALLENPRFAAVLQFYAGFTKLAYGDVRNVITESISFDSHTYPFILLSYVRCFFEAQIRDQSLYQELVAKLNGKLHLCDFNMSPLDCVSVGYFLAFALRSSKLIVDLSGCNIDDHSFGLMMRELSKHAESRALHGIELDIGRNKIISDKSIPLIFTADITITKLRINRSQISHKGAESLARALAVNRSLQELDIDNNDIGDSGIALIATVLHTNTTLTKLRISNCGISDEGAELLAGALAVNRSLQELGISYNDIGDSGITHIATALQTNTTLTKLHISDCSITDEGAELLTGALAVNRSLQGLHVERNDEIGEKGIDDIATALQTNTTVTTLDIGGCNRSNEGEYCELARALAVNKSLQELYFEDNIISYNGITQIAESLWINSTLKKLWIGAELCTKDNDVLTIAAALTANKTIETLWLFWSSARPDHALTNIGMYVSKSSIKELCLRLKPLSDTEQRSKEKWLQCLEEGGCALIYSLEDSIVEELYLFGRFAECLQSLEAASAKVNIARRKKGLTEIHFTIV